MSRFIYQAGPQAALADIARRYIGATESGDNRMGSDARMRQIFEADDYRRGGGQTGSTDGYPWCASFVSLCIQVLVMENPRFRTITPPREASVNAYRRLARSRDYVLITLRNPRYSPHRGDIVIYKKSHMGIVESVTADGIAAIEGNTNVEGSREGTTVRINPRSMSEIAHFIRLPYLAAGQYPDGGVSVRASTRGSGYSGPVGRLV